MTKKEKIAVMVRVLGNNSSWTIQLKRFSESDECIFNTVYSLMAQSTLVDLENQLCAIQEKIKILKESLE